MRKNLKGSLIYSILFLGVCGGFERNIDLVWRMRAIQVVCVGNFYPLMLIN